MEIKKTQKRGKKMENRGTKESTTMYSCVDSFRWMQRRKKERGEVSQIRKMFPGGGLYTYRDHYLVEHDGRMFQIERNQ